MRSFEVTGLKSCLVTDNKVDTARFFEDGKEIVVFRNYKDLKVKLNSLLKDENKLYDITKNGHEKTIKYHSFNKRFYSRIKELLK